LHSFSKIILLIFISAGVFLLSNILLDGSLKNHQNLSGELKSPQDSLFLWKIGEEAPFKYRVLHKAIIATTNNILTGSNDNNAMFFSTYRFYALIFHIAATLLFYLFLSEVGLNKMSLTGSILFAILPAMSVAYIVPLHTREDTLGYCLLLVGLIAMNRNNILLVLLATILGVLCRETLLVIPFINLFFNNKQKIWLRFFISAISFGIFIYIRWFYGVSNYDPWEGLKWNIKNLEQVVAFGYITFGVLWLPILLACKKSNKLFKSNQLIERSSLIILILILSTTFLGGIFNEIRLLYLLAPWIIYFALNYYIENEQTIKNIITSSSFKRKALLIFMSLAMLNIYAILVLDRFIKLSRYNIPYGLWITIGVIQVYFGILFLVYQNHMRRKANKLTN
jgi:hypothetical protein